MLKKSFFLILITIFMLIPSSSGFVLEENNEFSANSGKIFLIGTLFNPIESNLTVNANAISLVYYNHSAMNENIGHVQGFRKVSFEKQPFFYLYKPGPFGLIAYAFGFCKNFEVK